MNMQERSMKINFVWMLLGNGVHTACQWGVLASLNKMGGPGAAGLFLFAYAVVLPLSTLSNFNFRIVYITNAVPDISFRYYIGARYFWNVVLVMLVGIVAISLDYGNATTALAFVGMALAASMQSAGDLFAGFFQKLERLDIAALSNALKGVFNFASVFVVFFFSHSVVLSIIALALSRCLCYCLYDVPMANRLITGRYRLVAVKELSWLFTGKTLRELTWAGLPLGINGILGTLSPQLPRLFLGQEEGLSALGIFGSIAQVVVGGSMLITALGAVITPRLARAYSESRTKEFWRISRYALSFALFLGLAGICLALLVGRELLVLLYTPEFAGYENILVLCMISATAAYVGCLLTMMLASVRRFRFILVAAVCQCATTLLGTLALVPTLGVTGAAYSLIVANSFHLVLAAVFLFVGTRDMSLKSAGATGPDESVRSC
ncbi:lipopolysaccharide biosynthesis protein [Aporhodopirellula aestuarii]|uniref:Lipopolysaccharide biosynthesis protein n=1 Tax=Aporhodopirellula aestuarii TaxID=2950107 RepID=A0ABT0UE59_9BACT|nr:lipopolysaccharide biosynthesis protein [Aporhodopirellula aestuarii]MCM2375179.1 lipopolysaccharide biosynthesis protein [Aporhodopirellula aestuarii]